MPDQLQAWNPRGIAITGVPHAEASATTNPERLVPLDRHQERGRVLEERHLGIVVDRADPFDPVAKLRSHACLEILPAAGLIRDVAGDPERPTELLGDLDRNVHALVRGEPAEEGQVSRVGPGANASRSVSTRCRSSAMAGICQVCALVIAGAYEHERLCTSRRQEFNLAECSIGF